MSDPRIFSVACERNREPILEVLREVLPDAGLVLEIASGTGMHGVHFAPRLPRIQWQPSDADEGALRSIEAWREVEPSENLLPPLRLDVVLPSWPIDRADAIFNANMIHISPFICTIGLFEGASRILGPGAPLLLYGPFMVAGAHTAPSNAAFDESLRSRDPRWGVRDQTVVARSAKDHGFAFERSVDMPANNRILVFRRGPR
jgi:hypothetical protein